MPITTSLQQDFRSEAEAIVADQQAARDAWVPTRKTGVCWSGLTTPEDPPKVETVEAVMKRLADIAAFKVSPRGRFLACLSELDDVGAYLEEVYRLRGYYNRSITTLNGPHADEHAIACCIRLLNSIGTPAAREGIAALADLLDEQAPAAQARKAA